MSRIAIPGDTGQNVAYSAELAAKEPVTSVPLMRVYGALALGVVCIAIGAIFTRVAEVPGTVSAFYRLGIAAIVLAPLFLRNAKRSALPHGWRIWLLAVLAGLFFMLDLAVWNTSLFLTKVANSTLLGNDTPIIVGLVALFIFRERLKISYWVGLAIAIGGMGIIVGHDLFSGSGFGLGDLLAMLAGFFYALYLLVIQRVRAVMDTATSLWISTAVGTVLLVALNVVLGRALWGFSLSQYAALIALGLVSQVVGYLSINFALGHLPASIVSPTMLGQPVLTAILAVPFLGEMLEPRQIVGGLVALVGIFLVNKGVNR